MARGNDGGGCWSEGSATVIAHATAAPAGVLAPQAAAALSTSAVTAADSMIDPWPFNRGVTTDWIRDKRLCGGCCENL
jgi:hypothetical protein